MLAERFLQLAYDSGKWEKWMLSNTRANDRDRSIIAGHYVFSTPECAELKTEGSATLARKGIELELHLKQQVRQSILRYLRHFRLVRSA